MLLLALLPALQGCATFLLHQSMGERREHGLAVERLVQTHDGLVVLYRARSVTYFAFFDTTREVPRWARIDFDTLPWRPSAELDTRAPTPPRRLFGEPARPPAFELPPDRDIPLLRVPNGAPDEEVRRYVEGIARTHRLSALWLSPPREGLVLVTGGDTGPGFVLFDPPVGADRVWWAIPARVLLTPLTLVIDPFFTAWVAYRH